MNFLEFIVQFKISFREKWKTYDFVNNSHTVSYIDVWTNTFIFICRNLIKKRNLLQETPQLDKVLIIRV